MRSLSDSRIVKAPFVAMSEIRKEIRTVDPNDPKIVHSMDVEEDEGFKAETTEEIHKETAIDDNVIDGSVSIFLRKAEQEAELILQTARNDAKRLREEARKQGYDVGYTEGMESARDEVTTQRNALSKKAKEMDAAYEEMIREAEPLMAGVISDLVDNMVGHYATNQEVILFLIRLALSEISTYGNFIIKVSPADFEYVLARKEELDREVSDKITFEIAKDSGLAPMDCLIETAYGSVDASLKLRRSNLIKELRLIADSLHRKNEG